MDESTETAPTETSLAERGARLMHQQCWCWGQDIRHAGNLLLNFGFTRTPSPEGNGSTRYTMRRPKRTVVLWGFGVCFQRRETGGIYVNRYDFRPCRIPSLDAVTRIWIAGEMSAFQHSDSPDSYLLLRDLALWIAHYERWVQRTLGCDYRRRTLSEWPRVAGVAESCARGWVRLAREIETSSFLTEASGKHRRGSEAAHRMQETSSF